MKKLLVFIIFLIYSLTVSSQRDFGYYYVYRGKISFTSEVKYDSIILKLPKESYLIDKMKKNFPYDLYFNKIPLKVEGNFSEKFVVLGPSKDDPRKYLTRVFIDGIKHYRMIIQIGRIEYIKLIDITKILFIIEDDVITIELPEIQI